jgi:hypothetical protein
MILMSPTPKQFHHPHDTFLSASLRFVTELIAWISGPWALALVSNWLIFPAIIVLVGLPSVFSTPNDKHKIIISTPGPVRVGLELLLYAVAAVAPWYVWPIQVSGILTGFVVLSLVTGFPRFLWLLDGAPLSK